MATGEFRRRYRRARSLLTRRSTSPFAGMSRIRFKRSVAPARNAVRSAAQPPSQPVRSGSRGDGEQRTPRISGERPGGGRTVELPSRGDVMRAAVYPRTGEPSEVLSVAEIAEPHAGAGQVRIAVRAAGVNPIDWK